MNHSRSLSREQIQLLRLFGASRGLSVEQLKLSMATDSFTWQTLQRALEGKPIRESNYQFILNWLQRHFPHAFPRGWNRPVDGKSAAAGERELDEQEAEEVEEGAAVGVGARRLRSE